MIMLPNSVTHSSLDIFQKPPVLVNFDYGNMIKIFPVTGYDGPTIEFEIRTERNVCLDLQDICLAVNVEMFLPAGTAQEKKDYIPDHLLVNNTLHSLFSSCDVTLNGEVVSKSNGLYPHRAFLTTEWSHTNGCKSATDCI